VPYDLRAEPPGAMLPSIEFGTDGWPSARETVTRLQGSLEGSPRPVVGRSSTCMTQASIASRR
jgi:hypothetical protein